MERGVGRTSIVVRAIRRSRRCLSFLDESTHQQSERRREAQEQRERERRARRRSLAVRAVLIVGAVAVAILGYRTVQLARREAATRQSFDQLSQQRQSDQAAAAALRAQLDEALKRSVAANANPVVSPEDKLRNAEDVKRLTASLEQVQARSKTSEEALIKLRKDQELANADRGGLLSRIDALQTGTRLAAQEPRHPAETAARGLMQALQKSLEDERARGATAAARIKTLETENARIKVLEAENAELRKRPVTGTPPPAPGRLQGRIPQGGASLRPEGLERVGAVHARRDQVPGKRQATRQGRLDLRRAKGNLCAAVLSRRGVVRDEGGVPRRASGTQAGRSREPAERDQIEAADGARAMRRRRNPHLVVASPCLEAR